MKGISSTLRINYKKIEHERIEDAPFMGALISACDCRFNCAGCFNQELKKIPTLNASAEEIIREVTSNCFNKGIILGGLEWSLQQEQCIELCRVAKENNLVTMVYTGLEYDSSFVKALCDSDCVDYVKCGRYNEAKRSVNHIEYGVVLASDNQHIYKIKG